MLTLFANLVSIDRILSIFIRKTPNSASLQNTMQAIRASAIGEQIMLFASHVESTAKLSTSFPVQYMS